MVKSSKVSINVILLGIVSFLTDVSSEMMMPILPMFIIALGGTALIVGLIGGLSDSISSILQVFSGHLSDKYGRRKPFVFLGYLISAISKLFLPFSVVWQHILVLRPVERIGKGLRTAPRDAIIADSSTREVRGKAFGIHRAMDTSGAILGSILALLLFWIFKMDFRFILMVSATIAFLALPSLYPVKEVKRKLKKTLTLNVSLRNLPKRLRLFILVATVFSLANFTYMFFILKAQEVLFHIYPEKMAIIIPIFLYVLFNIVYTIFSVPSGILSDKYGRRKVLMIGYLIFGLTCLSFAFLTSTILLIILFCFYGLAYALIEANQRAFTSDLAIKELRGTALGTFHTCVGLAALPSSLIAGALWQYIDSTATFVYGFILSIIALTLLKKVV